LEVEAEVDRRVLCEKILAQIEAATQRQMYATTSQLLNSTTNLAATATDGTLKTPKGPAGKKQAAAANKSGTTVDKTLQDDKLSTIGGKPDGATLNIGGTIVPLDNITIGNYTCDFGNVVVGNTKKKSFRFTNTGRLPINFSFDKKILANYGISIEPDKV